MTNFFQNLFGALARLNTWQHIVLEICLFCLCIIVITMLSKFFRRHIKVVTILFLISLLIVAVCLARLM